jgi:hypothetical protein
MMSAIILMISLIASVFWYIIREIEVQNTR